MARKKLRIVRGFRGSTVSIRKGARFVRIELDDTATQDQLYILYDAGHESVEPDIAKKKDE